MNDKRKQIFYVKSRPKFVNDIDVHELERNMMFSNFSKTRTMLFFAFAAISFFLVLRLLFYSSYSLIPGYKVYTLMNGFVVLTIPMILTFYRKFQPDSPNDITGRHIFLISITILYCMILLSVAAGVEYLSAGTYTRFILAVFCLSATITARWYYILFFILVSAGSSLLTIFALKGDPGRFMVDHVHVLGIILASIMISRVFYFSSAKHFFVRKEMAKTNQNLKEEVDRRVRAIDDLKVSESRFRTFFEKSPDAYILYDIEDEATIEINPFAEELFLLKNSEIVGLSYNDIVILSDVQKTFIGEIVLETVAHKFSGPHEFEIQRIDGSAVVVELRSSLAMIKGRDAVLGTVRDITRRRITEEALKRSYDELENRVKERTAKLEEANERLKQEIVEHRKTENTLRKTEEQSRVLIEKMNDGFLVFDDKMNITYANDMLCEMVGCSWEHMIGNKMVNFIPEDNLNIVREQEKKRENGERGSYELTLLKDDGRRINAIISPEPLFGENGLIEGSFSVVTDITKIKEMEAALRESEEIARALLDASQDSVLMLKVDGTVLAANEMAGASLRVRTGSAITGKNVFDMLPEDMVEFKRKKLVEAAETRNMLVYEDENEGHYYEIHIYPIYDEGAEIERVAVFTRDVTELKNAEQHIHSLSQELIKVQENERQRISRDLHDNVAQDLATVKIGCDTLSGKDQDISRDLSRKVLGFSRILQRAIMSIRDLAYDLRPPGLDQLGLVSTLSRYCDDYSDRNLVRVDFYSAGVAELVLNFDTEINLYRIVQEALNNVKKHSEASLVNIRLTASFPTIILRVEDDGKGFDVNKRREASTGEKRMGLRSMEERAALLKGAVRINSREMHGTQVIVEIPLEANVNEKNEDQAVC